VEGRESSESRDFPWLVILSLGFFVLVALAFWREYHSEWAPLEKHFKQILEEHGHIEDARRFSVGIKQIWNPQLGVVDRCVTCHLGYDWGSVLPANLPEPFTPHVELPYLEKHPFGRFGCTVCHGGQGWATERIAAHSGGEHWDDPMISKELAGSYHLTVGQMIQMRCNFCHRHDLSTQGMDEINLAKKLVQQKKCRICHTIEGKGGMVGPELTFEGDKSPELLDFSHVSGDKTMFNWEYQHLMDPGKVSPSTTMPTFGFKPEEARALTLLLLSWRHVTFPPQYIPSPVEVAPLEVVHVPAEAPIIPGAEEGRKIFQTRGCNQCHTIGAGKLIGPDLAGVGGRHSVEWLRGWLADPASVIRANPDLAKWPDQFGGIVMPNQNLSPAEITAVIAYLQKL
jgi:cytochrome c2